MTVSSIVLRVVVFSFCCSFNFYACWSLETSERKLYFNSKDLEGKLAEETRGLACVAPPCGRPSACVPHLHELNAGCTRGLYGGDCRI